MTTAHSSGTDPWSRFIQGYVQGTKTVSSIMIQIDNKYNTAIGEYIALGIS